MENTLPDNAAVISSSTPDKVQLKDCMDPSPGSVVLQDECGDALWNKVLAQEKPQTPKGAFETLQD